MTVVANVGDTTVYQLEATGDPVPAWTWIGAPELSILPTGALRYVGGAVARELPYQGSAIATNSYGADSVAVTLVVEGGVAPGAALLSFNASEDEWEVLPSGLATGKQTFRPFLPWNHSRTAAGFNPINNCPQVYVFPQFLGLDNQPIGVNPFSAGPDGTLRITSALASPSVQSNVSWPGSATPSRGYRTSGSLSLMGIFQAQYGRIKIRMRVTDTIGFWPEFWVVPAWGEGADYEIDLELRTGTPTKVSYNHYTRNWDAGTMSNQPIPSTWATIPGGKSIGEFIDYEFHWTRDFIRYYTDGILQHEIESHDFHTPGTLLISYASGNGVSGWQDWPDVGATANPAHWDIQLLEWEQSPSDIEHMPVQVSRPAVTGGSGGTVSPGDVITVTPGVVTGATLQERVLIVSGRKIPSTVGSGLSKTLPENLDDLIASGPGSWNPLNVLETWTNPQGGITLARSADVLYRVKGAAAPPGSSWVIDEERLLGQDIGGSEWYKTGVTFSGNSVTETTAGGEHGVGRNGMPRSAGAIVVLAEAVVSAVSGHSVLQMQMASGSWSHGGYALFPVAGGSPTLSPESSWTVLDATNESLGGGQRRLRAWIQTDASSTDFVWLLRGYVGGSASYAGSASRQFRLVSASIKRVAGVAPPPAAAPTITTNGGNAISVNSFSGSTLSVPLAATGTAPINWAVTGANAGLFTVVPSTGASVAVQPTSPPLPIGAYSINAVATNDTGSDSIPISVSVTAAPPPPPYLAEERFDSAVVEKAIVNSTTTPTHAGAMTYYSNESMKIRAGGGLTTQNNDYGTYGITYLPIGSNQDHDIEVIGVQHALRIELRFCVGTGWVGEGGGTATGYSIYLDRNWAVGNPMATAIRKYPGAGGPGADIATGAALAAGTTTITASTTVTPSGITVTITQNGGPNIVMNVADTAYRGSVVSPAILAGGTGTTAMQLQLGGDADEPPAGDEVEITGVTSQAPGNTFVPDGYSGPWGYNRNVFAPGPLVDNGSDFTLRQWRSTTETWPAGLRMEWDFPNVSPTPYTFCWGYPGLTYGRGPWGPIWGTSGHPEPMKAGEIGELKVALDLMATGTASNDILLDLYTLPDLDFDGDSTNEISVLLTSHGTGPSSWLAGEATAQITLPAPLGTCAVYKQPAPSIQVMVMPHTAGVRREILSGTLDLKAVVDALIAIGQVDPDAWIAGFELGVETQRPNAYNSAPYSGSLRFNSAPAVTWLPSAPEAIGFEFLSALNFSGQPDLAPYDIEQIEVVYEQELYPGVPRIDRGWPIPPAGLAAFDARVAAAGPNAKICIDLEYEKPELMMYPWTKNATFQAMVVVFRDIAAVLKPRMTPGQKLGFYGYFPTDNPLPNAAVAEHVHPRAEMVQHNTWMSPVIAEVDFLAPCCYLSGTYDPGEVPGDAGVVNGELDSRAAIVINSIATEAERIAPGLPCYLFVSPETQNTQTQQYPSLPYSAVKAQIDICAASPLQGVILWGGYDIGTPPRESDGNIQLVWPGANAPFMQAIEDKKAEL